jgi:hypothetical protein
MFVGQFEFNFDYCAMEQIPSHQFDIAGKHHAWTVVKKLAPVVLYDVRRAHNMHLKTARDVFAQKRVLQLIPGITSADDVLFSDRALLAANIALDAAGLPFTRYTIVKQYGDLLFTDVNFHQLADFYLDPSFNPDTETAFIDTFPYDVIVSSVSMIKWKMSVGPALFIDPDLLANFHKSIAHLTLAVYG